MADQSYTIEAKCPACGAVVTLYSVVFKGEMIGVFTRAKCGACGVTSDYALRRPEEKLVPAPAPPEEVLAKWGKPTKTSSGEWLSVHEVEGRDLFYAAKLYLTPGQGIIVTQGSGDHATTAPVDVVLRILAAEASDRLGWQWRVVTTPGGPRVTTPANGDHIYWWSAVEVAVDGNLNHDELLAIHHGRFLLMDLLAGNLPVTP